MNVRPKAAKAGRIVRALDTHAGLELAFGRTGSANLLNEAAREIERLRRVEEEWRFLAKKISDDLLVARD